jgi:hypothetical protein
VGNNKQFNTILDECMERLLTGQETVEQCLQRYPEYAAELEPLLRTATIVKKAVDIEPSADFRARARYQLQSMMAESKAPRRTVRFSPRWAVAVCVVMLVFVLGGGTVLAANSSMPGSPLYTVKLATENLSIKFAGSAEKKAELYVTLADRRVTEMVWMVDNNKTQNIEAAATRLNNYYTKIGELPLVGNSEVLASGASAAGSQSPQTNSWGLVVTTATPTVATTTVINGDIITSTTTEPPMAAVTETNIPPMSVTSPSVTYSQPSASGQKGTNATNGNPTATNKGVTLNANDTAKLMDILFSNSITQPELIQQLLDSNKVPESVKPALRRVLAASKMSYQNAIYNLSNSSIP